MNISDSQFADKALLADAIIDTAQAIILVLDLNGKIVRFNRYLETISGYRLDEVQGRDWFETFLPKSDHSRIRALFSSAIDDCQTHGNVNPIVTKDGRLRQIEWHDTTLKDGAGRVMGLLAIGQDVTERLAAEATVRRAKEELEARVAQRTEELTALNLRLTVEAEERRRSADALRSSERKHRLLVENAPFCIHLLDRALCFISINRTGLANLGFAQQAEAVGAQYLRSIAEQDREFVEAKLKEVFLGRTVAFEFRTKNGHVMHSSVVPILEENGRIEHVMGMNADITERRAAEEALRESERRLASLIDNLPGIVYRCENSPAWPVSQFSGAVEQITGYAAQSFLDRSINFGELIHPDDAGEVWEAVQSGVQNGRPYQLTYRIVDREGNERWVWEQGCGTYSDARKLLALEGFIADITDRKRAEEALRKNERRLRQILDGMFTFVGLYDTEGTLLEANRAPLDAAGLKREDVLGKPFWETYWWSYSTEVQEQLKHALRRAAQGETVRYDVAVRVAGEKLITVDVMFGPLFDAEGRVVQLIGSAVDVTERIRMERSLRTREQQLIEAQRIAHLGNWNWDILGNELSWSDEIYRVFGLEPQQFGATYDAFLERVHPDDRPLVENGVLAALERNEPYSLGHRIVRPTGETRFVHEQAEVEFLPDGRPARMAGTVQDITESKRIEDELRRSEAKFRRHFENNPIPIYCWQKHGDDFKLLDFNPAAVEATGGNVEQMHGARLSNWYADMPQVLQDFHDVAETQRAVVRNMEYIMRTTGERRSLRVRYVFVPPDMVMVHSEDRTKERRLEEEARLRQEQLAHVARLATMGEMASGIAHEINQPLTAITAYADSCTLLCDQSASSPAVKQQVVELLGKISEQCLRAGAIIHRVLQLSRRSRPHRTTVDMNALVERVTSFLGHDERLSVTSVERRLAAELPNVCVDPIQIEQVLLNLIRNALDAMEACAPETRSLVLSTVDRRDGSVEVSVQDTGKGIPEHELESVFSTFRSSRPDGLGLGLAISRSIVEAHHGRLEARLNPDRGVTFTAILPIDSSSVD